MKKFRCKYSRPQAQKDLREIPNKKFQEKGGDAEMGKSRKIEAMQKKHLTVQEQQEHEAAEAMVVVGREQLEKPPSWLTDTVAKKEFNRIVKELAGIEIVGNLDIGNLGAYCNAYSMYLKATKALKKAPLTITKLDKYGNEYDVENPLINIQKKYAEEMRKFAALCGMTIDSRLKAATIKVHEEDGYIENEFGNI